MNKTDELVFAIQAMPPAKVRRARLELESYLRHRSPAVRSVAVEALIRGRAGAGATRSALQKEKNELVLAALCEAALLAADQASVPLLKRHARHRSWLVRKHAAWAVAEIEEARAIPFLRKMLSAEVSRRVRPILQAALFKWGANEALPALLENLGSRDYLVRCITANALGDNVAPRRTARPSVLEALRAALRSEQTVAAREALTNALAVWNRDNRQR
jgi:HEAT repeat protein